MCRVSAPLLLCASLSEACKVPRGITPLTKNKTSLNIVQQIIQFCLSITPPIFFYIIKLPNTFTPQLCIHFRNTEPAHVNAEAAEAAPLQAAPATEWQLSEVVSLSISVPSSTLPI